MLLHGSILTIILNQKKLTITESYCDHYLYNIKIQVSHYYFHIDIPSLYSTKTKGWKNSTWGKKF